MSDDYMLYAWQLGMIAEEERRMKERKKKEEEEKAKREEEDKQLEELVRRHPHARCSKCGFWFLIEEHPNYVCPECGTQNERGKSIQEKLEPTVVTCPNCDLMYSGLDKENRCPRCGYHYELGWDSANKFDELEYIESLLASSECPVTLNSILIDTNLSLDTVKKILSRLIMLGRVKRKVHPDGLEVYTIVTESK